MSATTTRVEARRAVEPFPFAALPAFGRAEIAARTRLLRAARTLVRLDALEHAALEILGQSTRARLVDVRVAALRGPDDSVGILLAPGGERSPAERVLVELDGALAGAIAALAVRQKAPAVHDPSKPASPALAGASAAVIAAVLRRSSRSGEDRAPLRVIAAGPGAALARDFTDAAGPASVAYLSIALGGETFGARVTISDSAPIAIPMPTFDDAALAALGDLALALPLVVARVVAHRAEALALAPGDLFVVPSAPTDAQRVLPDGSVAGTVALVAARSERGLGADLAPPSRLVLRGSTTLAWDPSAEDLGMAPGSANTNEALEDAPVVVRVEVGVVEMKAREWSQLGPGDVVTLGRKLGDPVVLRASGVELARGELVQVDGEMAVRILARTRRDGEGEA